MADYNEQDEREGEKRSKVEVIIEDLRHRRGDDEGGEPEEATPTTGGRPADPEPAPLPPSAGPAAATAAAPAAPAAPAISSAPPAVAASETAVVEAGAGDIYPADGFEGEDDLPPGEMEQIRALFSGGLINYLRGQLGLLLNFALLGMGRAADPGTGLVTKNLPQAKIAIDLLEFMVARLEPQLPPEEQTQMKALVSDLKYAFMQAAAEPVPGTPDIAEG